MYHPCFPLLQAQPMPRSRTDPDLLRAIGMVADGMSARAAWEACGEPNGEPGIQNIRKAGKKLSAATHASTGDAAATAEPEPEPPLPQYGKGKPKAGFRQAFG